MSGHDIFLGEEWVAISLTIAAMNLCLIVAEVRLLLLLFVDPWRDKYHISQLHNYMTKNIGPRTLPWVNPFKAVAGSDFIPLKLTIWQPLLKKALIHSNTLPLIPCDSSLPSSLSWGTLSNALLKSKCIVSTTIPDTIVSMYLSR